MIRAFAAHRTAANLLMLAIIVLGLIAAPRLQRDTFPEIPPTEVEVRIPYPGAGPADVERGVCARVEDPLGAIAELEELRCDARENLAIVTAEMREGHDFDAFYDDVKSAMDGVDNLPDRVEIHRVTKLERVAVIASVVITAPIPPRALFAYAEGVRERLRGHPGIAQATLLGFSGREIAIEFPDGVLRSYGLTPEDAAEAIARSSLDLPAGIMEMREGDALIRFEGESRRASEFEAIPLISSPLGGQIRLGDVARIESRFSDRHDAVLFNGKRCAIIEIAKTDAQDALHVRAALDEMLERERMRAPDGVRFEISQDRTANIRDRLRILLVNGAQGLALVFAVMWLFFGLRFSFWVVLGLPVSFLGAIFAMNALGLTINMITMIALLVAIGLLMDDAIVIAENIVAKRREGKSPLEAAIDGARQVAPGVISSFLTTAMIVGPLAFMSGKMGAILSSLPVILLITLAVSLVEAFLILPHHLMHSIGRSEGSRFHRRVDSVFEAFRDRVFMPLARAALRWRYVTLGLAGFLLLASLAPWATGRLKYQAFPTLESDVIQARLLLPEGSPFERTRELAGEIETALRRIDEELTPLQPGGARLVRSVTVTYGANIDAKGSGPNMATVSADLLRAEHRSTGVSELLTRWKDLVGPLPDIAALRFTDKERGVAGKAIEIRLQGESLEKLTAAADELTGFIGGFAGIRDVSHDLRPGKPEFSVRLRPGAAGVLGVQARDVAEALRRAVTGDTDLEFQDRSGSVDVVARLVVEDRAAAEDLLELQLPGLDGALVPLSAVAEVEESRGYARIQRIDGRRTVTVEGTIDPDVANSRELMMAVKKRFWPKARERFPGVSLAIRGQSRESRTTGASIETALVVGFLGVFMILAYQMRSYVQPFAVLAAIPFGLVGAIWGHVMLGLQLSMPSLVGLATLSGVVVNDSILLVAFLRERLQAGEGVLRAAELAIRGRFRAIVLTSVTTVAGLTPLLLETSTQAQFLIPLVASLAFGLSAATILSLFVTPVVYTVLSDAGWVRVEPDQAADDPQVTSHEM